MTLKLKTKRQIIQANAWIFFCLVTFNMNPFALAESRPKITEELSANEKQSMIKELIAEGDRYVAEKNYNLGNAAYESIFLLDSGHTGASERIDRLKKAMLKEGKSETDLVTRVYDSEIDVRVRIYLTQAKEFINAKKLGQARFALRKLLLINPLHEEGEKLYRELNREPKEAQ